jgi:hypothetical protein
MMVLSTGSLSFVRDNMKLGYKVELRKANPPIRSARRGIAEVLFASEKLNHSMASTFYPTLEHLSSIDRFEWRDP